MDVERFFFQEPSMANLESTKLGGLQVHSLQLVDPVHPVHTVQQLVRTVTDRGGNGKCSDFVTNGFLVMVDLTVLDDGH
jgi:hypothetical protein